MIRLCEVLQTVSRNTDGRFALHKMMLYFAYGSNMSLRRIQARTPSARVIDTAQLSGHEIRFHKKSWKDGSAKCDIFYTGKVQDVVFGVVFEINLVERPLLDEAEGLHNGYECKTIDVEITTGGRSSRLSIMQRTSMPVCCLLPGTGNMLSGARGRTNCLKIIFEALNRCRQ